MKLIPDSIGRALADQVLVARKNSPSILLGVGLVSMVGSTVMACRATLKMEETLSDIEQEKNRAKTIKHHVESVEYKQDGGQATYTDDEHRQDLIVIHIRGAAQVIKLYTPALVLGAAGIFCLTKSHMILRDRNAALAAAYIAIDSAFQAYRSRVVDRYGEDVDRELRYGSEDVTVIDEETGKAVDMTVAEPGEPSGYARWFDETNANWSNPNFMTYNWLWLRTQQNWANDILKSRGHIFLNEVYALIGLSHTTAGAIVGWLYDRDNDHGDNYIDFGCWDQKDEPLEFHNGREGAILLDFNVDGPIWQLIDERNAAKS